MGNLQTSKQEPNIALRIGVIVLAAFIMGCNTRFLVKPAGLFPGGAAGLTLLFQAIFEKFLNLTIPYTVINVFINSIPVFIGFKFIGKKFTMYSCVMIFLMGFFTDLLPHYQLTNDILLSSVFGGLLNGLALSLVLSVDATSGGTDFIAIFMSNKKGMDSFNMVLGINACILTAAGILFGWDKALYSIIFQYVSTQMLHLLYKKYQRQTLFIVTDHPEVISKAVFESSHHGATIMRAEGSYAHQAHSVVYSVVSAAEYQRVIRSVKKADPTAFINAIHTEQLSGTFYQRPVA